jgi:hypothetical protein
LGDIVDTEMRLSSVGMMVKNWWETKQTEYEYYHRLSKPIIDEIDRVLAVHYGLTDEELDFIINYDIKYRMGRNAGEENKKEDN